MSTSSEPTGPTTGEPPERAVLTPADAACDTGQRQRNVGVAHRWWIKLLVQPALLLAAGALLFAGLGAAQRLGWISAGGGGDHSHAADGDQDAQYICPMMCTPPQAESGRCPVCAMELVPSTSGTGDRDATSVQIDPAARRLANIQTVAVRALPLTRSIEAIGELHYNEGGLRVISAYVDGRVDRLLADYTGVEVDRSDRLALFYSPRLYSGQVELLLAGQARADGRRASLARVLQTSHDVYENARQKLIELGMTQEQIDEVEQAGQASSRMFLTAPTGGTVIEKLAVEGQYVKEGEPIYRLADLSTVWLMLELFPGDAAAVRAGQQVEAEVSSLPGRKFAGHVAFVDPSVDQETRTVSVRVVIPNPEGLLRIGDYANAVIEVPLDHEALVVPRDAVLMAGGNSVAYVETEPGRFEIREVVLGAKSGDEIAILSGLQEGEQVAVRGNFLIDSQMQLAGNPSLIDPTRAEPKTDLPPIEMPVVVDAGDDLPPIEAPQAIVEEPAEGERSADGAAIPVAGLPGEALQ